MGEVPRILFRLSGAGYKGGCLQYIRALAADFDGHRKAVNGRPQPTGMDISDSFILMDCCDEEDLKVKSEQSLSSVINIPLFPPVMYILGTVHLDVWLEGPLLLCS